jgi:glycosyltransferase involved in cell wall biosynthesis
MGGSAVVAYELSKHLAARGHQVTVLTTDYASKEKEFPTCDFQVVRLPNIISGFGFYVSPQISKWLKANLHDFDLIHMHEVRTFQNAMTRHYAKNYGTPFLISAHGTLPVIVQRKLAKRVYDFLYGNKLLEDASVFVAVSPAEVEQYRQAGIEKDRIRMIYNGLDLKQFAHLPPRGSFLGKLGISREKKVILYLGRLHRRKGIDYLIEAFANMEPQLGNIILVIAGPDAGELRKLQHLVKSKGLVDRVYFSGPLFGREKLAAYVDADVFVSPGVHEIFGLVPFEALMCGTPVIVADDCGAGRLISEANAGYTIPYGDVQALALKIKRGLANHEESTQMVMNGQDFIRNQLDWLKVTSEYEVLLLYAK